jgi:CRP-like cAMP-binding protein
MTEPASTLLTPTLASPPEQMFPTLTPAQLARIAEHGRVRQVHPGEVLVQAGDPVMPFFVVRTGPERGQPMATGVG